MCWDLHPCKICGLRNHSEKLCWQRDKRNTESMQMDCGWSFGMDWQKVTGMLRKFFKHKCLNGKEDKNQKMFHGHAKWKALDSESTSMSTYIPKVSCKS